MTFPVLLGAATGTSGKKRRRKKKTTAASSESAAPLNGAVTAGPSSSNSTKKPAGPRVQTSPPSVPIDELFPDGQYPLGEMLEYPAGLDGCAIYSEFATP